MRAFSVEIAISIAFIFGISACTPIKYDYVLDGLEPKFKSPPNLQYFKNGTWHAWESETTVDRWTKKEIVQRLPDSLNHKDERKEYSGSNEPPNICMCFSGGGIRSGSFSIGVMAALHDDKKLEAIDIMSSVSGGGYALSWFYMQHYSYGKGVPLNHEQIRSVRNQMFQKPLINDGRLEVDQSTYQGYLLGHSRLMREVDYAGMIVPHLIFAMPAHLIANGLLGMRTRIGYPYEIYKRRLAYAFHYGPTAQDRYIPTVYELGKFAKKSKLPFFLFNTTAWPGHVPQNELKLADSVFSFSPLRYGSAAYGLYKYYGDRDDLQKTSAKGEEEVNEVMAFSSEATDSEFAEYSHFQEKTRGKRDLKVHEVVALSGGAVDVNSLVPGRLGQTLASAFAIDLGAYIPNPAISESKRNAQKLLPIPFYFFKRDMNDLRGIGIYLSDGGHSENLGAYPLVSRKCKTIIVVDGEHDPFYRFDSYFRLKMQLIKENVKIEVADIETGVLLKKIETALSAPTRKKVDDVPEAYTDETMQKKVAENDWWPQPLREDPSIGDRWARFAAKPVMDGTIKDAAGRVIGNVLYVKLAYRPDKSGSQEHRPEDASITSDRDQFDSWLTSDKTAYYNKNPFGSECTSKNHDDQLMNYYYCIKQRRMLVFYPFGISDPFPQQPTVKDQNFSSEQFHAYVTLGRQIGKQLADKWPIDIPALAK